MEIFEYIAFNAAKLMNMSFFFSVLLYRMRNCDDVVLLICDTNAYHKTTSFRR